MLDMTVLWSLELYVRGMPWGNWPGGGAPGIPGKGGGTPRKFVSASILQRIEDQLTSGKGEWRRRECVTGLVLRKHGVRVGLALGGVGGGDGVDNGLGLFVANF